MSFHGALGYFLLVVASLLLPANRLSAQTSAFLVEKKARMNTPRYLASAVKLADGRVLVTGGQNVFPMLRGFTASAEIYNPATNVWFTARSMPIQMDSHSSTLLSDGRVVVSGQNASQASGIQYYNPSTNEWTQSNVAVDVWGHTALPNDEIILYGDGGWNLFDARNDALVSPTWCRWGAGQFVPEGHAVPTSNRKVILFGNDLGIDEEPGIVFVVDPLTLHSCVTGTGVQDPRPEYFHLESSFGGVLGDGRSIATGIRFGRPEQGYPLINKYIVYNPSTDQFTDGPDTFTRHFYWGNTLLDGRFLITGGAHPYDRLSYPVSRIFVGSPSVDREDMGPDLQENRFLHTAVVLNDGSVFIPDGAIRNVTAQGDQSYIAPHSLRIYPPLADLQIINASVNSATLVSGVYEVPFGKTFSFKTTVVNAGQAASVPCSLSTRITNTTWGSGQLVTAIAAQTELTLNGAGLTLPSGSYTVTFIVDSTNRVTEGSETNNQRTLQLRVLPALPPGPTPASTPRKY